MTSSDDDLTLIQRHITPHVLGHLYKAIHSVYEKVNCVEYPLRAVYDDGSDGKPIPLHQHPRLVFQETRMPLLTPTDKTVEARVFRHLGSGADLNFIVLPAEKVLGQGGSGSVYAMDIFLQREDGHGYYSFPMVMKMEVIDEPIVPYQVPYNKYALNNMFPLIPDILPTTLTELVNFVIDSDNYDYLAGPRSLPVRDYRYDCAPWYLESIAMHTIQQSQTLPQDVKAMSPRVYASLLVKEANKTTSILLMERFSDMITLRAYLNDTTRPKNLPKIVAQLVAYMAMIHEHFDGLNFDLHDLNVLVDPITHRIVVIDLALMSLTYQNIRFESWLARSTSGYAPNSQFLAQNRVNLRCLCNFTSLGEQAKANPEWEILGKYILPLIGMHDNAPRANLLKRAYDMIVKYCGGSGGWSDQRSDPALPATRGCVGPEGRPPSSDIEPLSWMPTGNVPTLCISRTDSLEVPDMEAFTTASYMYDIVEVELDSLSRWVAIKNMIKNWASIWKIIIHPCIGGGTSDDDFQAGCSYVLYTDGLPDSMTPEIQNIAEFQLLLAPSAIVGL